MRIIILINRTEGEGALFVMSEARYLLVNALLRLAEVVLRVGIKYLGCRAGNSERHLSSATVRKLSASQYYWN